MFTERLMSIVEGVSRHPRRALAAAAAALALSVLSISQLRINSTLSGMLGGGNPSAEALARINDDFEVSEDLLLLVSAPASLPTPDAEARLTAYAGRFADRARGAAEVAAGITGVRYRPDPSMEAYFRETVLPAGLLFLDDESFAALIRRLSPEEVRAQMAQNATMLSAPGPAASALAKQMVQDPLRLRDFFVSRFLPAERSQRSAEFSDDRHALLIRVSGARPVNDIEFSKRLTASVRELADRAEPGDMEVRIGGGYAVASTTATTIRSDAIASTISSTIAIHLFLALAYRRFLAPLTIMITAALGVAVAFGVYALAAQSITPLTAVIAAMLAGLGVDYAIHFRSHHDHLCEAGLSSTDASVRTTRELSGTLTAACVTSVFGFGTVTLSNVRMLKDFAFLGCLGLVGALTAVWLVLPALLALRPRRALRAVGGEGVGAAGGPPGGTGGTGGAMGAGGAGGASRRRLSGVVIELITTRPGRALGIGVCGAVATAVMVAATPHSLLRFESDPVVLHPQPNEPLETGRIIRERFGMMGESLFVRIVADDADGLAVRSHDVADRLATAGAREAGVSGTLGLASLVPDPRLIGRRLEALGDLDVDGLLAGVRNEIGRGDFEPEAFKPYLAFLRRMLLNREAPRVTDLFARPDIARQLLPAASVHDPRIAPGETIVLVTATNSASDRGARAELISRVREMIRDVPGATLTGLFVVSHDLELEARRDLVLFGSVSIVLVIGWLVVLLRRARDVALAFIPVASAILAVLAVNSALGERFNPVNIVSLPMLAGIAVDSGIFLVSAGRRAAKSGENVREAFRPTVHAMVCTAATTALGFGTLIFTHTPAVSTLGLAMLVGVMASLGACLFILLPILVWRAPRGVRSER